MSKHTPGPWKYEAYENGHGLSACAVRGTTAHSHIEVATLKPDSAIGIKAKEVEANARLIAAAPELLEALDRAHLEIVKLLNEGDFKRHVILDLGYIVDAIEKAEGK